MAIRVVVSGAAGRMGQTVCGAVEGAEDMELAGRADPALEVELPDLLGDADVVVDFTTPTTAVDNVAACLDAGCNDLGGVLMNESITRAAGAMHGQEIGAADLEAMIYRAGRVPYQRNTLYERVKAAAGARQGAHGSPLEAAE